jgi:predicted nucleotidyltransferase component of viral defense system
MLTQPQVRRYSNESGLRDIMIAEKEVVLTFLLQLLSERGILGKLAFKGGTCLRKIFIGSPGTIFYRSRLGSSSTITRMSSSK